MASIQGGVIALDAGSVKNQHISPGAEVDAEKLQHAYKGFSRFNLAIGATPATREEIVFVASGAGTINNFQALLNAVGSSTSCSFDLKKNGTTVLTGAVVITNGSNTNRQVVAGVLSSTAFVAGDVFSIALTATSTTGAQGPFAWASFIENTEP